MALTTLQKMSLFQILEVPWQPIATHLVDQDNQVGLQLEIQNASSRQAKAMIDDYITTYVDADADVLARVQTYLDRWVTLGTRSVRMESGGTGAITGVTSIVDEERMEIARQVKVIVPFYRKHEEIQRAKANTSSISVMR